MQDETVIWEFSTAIPTIRPCNGCKSGDFAGPPTGRGPVLLRKWRTNDGGVSFTFVTWVRIYRVGDAAILHHTRTKPRAAEVDGKLPWGAARRQ